MRNSFTMLVSCICVCHNKPDLTEEAIQSILDQSYPHWEALIVDSGVLYDAGYYEPFPWRFDKRIRLIRSQETEATRHSKAMAPWCFNECFRKGLVSGDLVMYLCDDDVLYPNAFETFVTYSRRNSHVHAMYASQDLGVIYPNGWRNLVGERRADRMGGRSCGGRVMDCEVDYLQFCHKPEVLNFFSHDRYWPEEKESESHADGIFMERIGEYVPIHPIDVKVSQNRRTVQSTYDPVSAPALIACMANGVPLRSCRTQTGGERIAAERRPLVTVCVGCFDNAFLLSDTLASLAAQTYPDLEVLVLDEESADLAAMASSWRSQIPRFRFLPNNGDQSGATWNRGLQQAGGVFFIPVQCGMLAHPDMVERFVNRMHRSADLGALTCYVLHVGQSDDGETATSAPPRKARLLGSMKNLHRGGIFHTERLRAVGGFEPDPILRGNEWTTFHRLVNTGYQVDLVPEHLFYHRHGDQEGRDAPNADLNLPTALNAFFDLDRLLASERTAYSSATADLGERVERLIAENHALETRLGSLRYRIADRLNTVLGWMPFAKQSLRMLLSAGWRTVSHPVAGLRASIPAYSNIFHCCTKSVRHQE